VTLSEESRIVIVEAAFYSDIAQELGAGAVQAIEEAGYGYERIPVPGVFEIPAAIRFAIRSMEIHSASATYTGFVSLGCVIRGETDHYEHIAREASRALMDLSVNYNVALGFGVLTCDTREQAMARAAVDQGNKGAEAARACLRMMEIKRELHLQAL